MEGDLAAALAHHQRGELAQADRLYRDVLAAEPDQPDALHLLGVLALQRGDFRQAVAGIERAIALQPGVAAFHTNLAEAYRLSGRLDRAAASCRVALALRPDSAEAANNLGSLLVQQGDIEEAAALFLRAVAARPDYAPAHNNLGNALRMRGEVERAIAHLRRALELDPTLAYVHGNLGQMLLDLNRPGEAPFHCREAARLQPDAAQVQNNLGNVLRKLGHPAAARACYAEALRLAPGLAIVHANTGQVAQDEGNVDEALRWFHEALRLEPNSPRFHTNLADALAACGDAEGAESHYRTALRHDPAYAEARLGLGRLRDEQGRGDEARDEFLAALRLQPNHPGACCSLGKILLEQNRREEALEHFRSALRGDPRNAPALSQLATHLRDELPPDERAALDGLLADPLLPDAERAALLFGLAQVCDARAEYDAAAGHLARANALEAETRRRRGRPYNHAAHVGFVDRLLATFTPGFFGRVAGFGVDSERPVFIVGLPRSGTTLLEQVLASHSRVFGGGELRYARDDFEALGRTDQGLSEARAFDALKVIDADAVRRLADDHLARLAALDAAADRVVDKMPDNYLYLGLLAVLFPRARVLHCVRDLRDVAVSCWMTHFREIPWADEAESIGGRFAEYLRVMDHWRRVLPAAVLDVHYESMVEDLEGVARRVVAWCGLGWEPSCLDFHRAARTVRTASVAQVRRPIYRRSLARWRNYENSLQPLLSRLPAPFPS